MPMVQSREAMSGEDTWRKEFLFVLILLSLCLLLFFFRLGTPPLWDGDEGMHAATSKDMVTSGDWITPTLNGEKFYDKPVLYNWFVSLSFLVFGFNEFAARLPSALLGTGCVLIVYLLGRGMFGPLAGLLSGVLLATTGEQMILSRVVVHDIALAFFITLSLFFFYTGYQRERNRRRYFLLFYASAGFSVLAKGPVGILLPLLIIGLFLLAKRRLELVKELANPWGIFIFFVVAAPWYVLILLRNREYGSYFFIQQNLMNFLSSEARHHGPFYFYFPVVMAGFFPWSCFLPLALIHALRKRSEDRDALLFLALWFLVIFAFFSAASSKLDTYVLPLMPASACMVGLLWRDLMKDPTRELRRGFLYSFILLFGILVIAVLYVWFTSFPSFKLDYGIDVTRLKDWGLPFLAAFVVPFGLFVKKHLKTSLLALAGINVCAFLLALIMIVPMADPYRSTKGFALKLDRMLAPGEKMVFVRVLRDSALFYTDRKALLITTRKDLTRFLESDRRVFCVMRKSLIDFDERWKQMAHIIDEEGHKAIVSNRK